MSKSGLLALAAGFSCAEEVKYTKLTTANGMTKSGNRRIRRDIGPPIQKNVSETTRAGRSLLQCGTPGKDGRACDFSSSDWGGSSGAPVARGKTAERSERGMRRVLGKSSGDTVHRRCRRTIREG